MFWKHFGEEKTKGGRHDVLLGGIFHWKKNDWKRLSRTTDNNF